MKENKINQSAPTNVGRSRLNIPKFIQAVVVSLLVFFQLNGLYYFLDYNSPKWILIAVIVLPLVMMNNYFVSIFNKRNNSVKEIVGTLVISFLFYIGLFLPYFNSFSLSYFASFLGYVVLLFVIIYLLSEFLKKAEWGFKETKPSIARFLIYFAVPMLAYTIFMLACYPGLISPDSVYILNQAVAGGPYDNLSPLLYTLFLRFLTVIGLEIGGMMILQCIMCAAAYAYVVYTFDRMGLPMIFCLIGIFLLAVYPMNLMTTITLWKDIPYTIGLTLIMTELVKLNLREDYFKRWQNTAVLIFALIITLVARHNGIVTVVLTFFVGAIIFFVKKNRRTAVIFGAIIASSVVFYYCSLYGSIAILGDKYQEPEDNKVTQTSFYALRIQGLIAVYHDKWENLSKQDKEYMDKFLDLEAVDEHIVKYEENWRFRSYTKNYVDADELLSQSREFNAGYIRLLQEYPFEVINAYLKTTGIVWAAPSYGYTMHAAYTYNVYDSEKYSNLNLSQDSYLPKFKDYILLKIFWKTAETRFYAILWRPAIFMLVLLLFLYHALRKKRYVAWLIAAPAIINSLGYLIVNEAQDARYVYINFAAALIMIAYAMMEKKKVEAEKANE